MINKILQFIKKTILALKLARYNLLGVISGLKTFRRQLLIARFFNKKNKQSLPENLRAFLQQENNPLLDALADDLSARSDIIGTDSFYLSHIEPRILKGEILFKTAAEPADKVFYRRLFAELVRKDFPEPEEQNTFFGRRLDVLQDMRLYASELEELEKNISAYDGRRCFEIDWIRCQKENLYLQFKSECQLTDKLSPEAQEDFVKLFGYLLFEKNLFVSAWQGVAVMPNGQTSLLDFDFIYQATGESKTLIKSSFDGTACPKNDIEYKLLRALKLLKHYCPQVDVAALWHNYLQLPDSKIKTPASGKQLLQNLQSHGVVMKTTSEIIFDEPEDLAYLLDSRRHKNDPRFRKSTIWYWGPLLIAIYFLYRYF